jgi:hypothetical protein
MNNPENTPKLFSEFWNLCKDRKADLSVLGGIFFASHRDAMMLNDETRSNYEKEGSMRRTAGRRCKAKRNIRSHQGFVSADTRGTITGEIENLGRRLIAVRWDNGLSIYVFSEEIAIDADADFAGR